MKMLSLGIFVLLFACSRAFAGDAFLKAGLVIHPTNDLSASDRYLIDFGSDYQVGYMVGLGWEIATAYYSQDFGSDKLRQVPIYSLINLKISSPTEGVRPFGKLGFGAFTNIFNFQNDTSTETHAVFHLTGGIEVTHAVIELQGVKSFESGSDFKWILLGGFTW